MLRRCCSVRPTLVKFEFLFHRNHLSTGKLIGRASSHRIDSKSAGAYTRRGQLSWVGVALQARSSRLQVKIGIAVDGFQFLGKAVKIGHGPATVIGCRWDARFFLRRVRWQALRICCGVFEEFPPLADSQGKRKSGNLPELVEADTLRARECGETPRSIREAFLLRGRIFWR